MTRSKPLRAPFPWFGGKRSVAADVWERLGEPNQYIEPFLGSAAVLLAAPRPASLEVAGDLNGFVANFWRCLTFGRAEDVAKWADYPVSHVDLGARHKWLLGQVPRLGAALQDAHWPGDPQVAGWWLWGQCSWIGSGWCDWTTEHVSNAGMGVQAIGQIPHVSNAGMGGYLTTGGLTAHDMMARLARRLDRVRLIHGDWTRCLSHHYGGDSGTAIFFDPPYVGYERLYSADSEPVARAVESWSRERGDKIRIALCGHVGDYDLPGWEMVRWSRARLTYSGEKTKDKEAIWYSPACLRPSSQAELFI